MKNCTLKITNANTPLTTQDLGRWGYQHIGVSPSGAADKFAHQWANKLLGNNKNCATLEIFLGRCCLQFNTPTLIALAGADCDAKLNGKRLSCWQTASVTKGSTLTLAQPSDGLYTYLAVRSGFKVDHALNSRSICPQEAIGPNQGCVFKKGSNIDYEGTCEAAHTKFTHKQMHWKLLPDYKRDLTLRFIPTTQNLDHIYTYKNTIENNCFSIDPRSSKMGVRLNSGTQTKPEKQAILSEIKDKVASIDCGLSRYSEGIVLGGIQIPPSGEPIILTADHQTIGGYPLMGTVYTVDLYQLAQRRPGQKIKLKLGSLEEAQQSLTEYHTLFNEA